MKFEVDQNLVEPIIRNEIAAAVIAQLGDPSVLLQRMVGLALRQKVSSNGTVSQYSSDNKHDFVEALAGNAIREAAREAIEFIVAEQKPKIQAAIEDELRKSPKKTAAAIVAAFIEGPQNPYRINASFTITTL